MLPQIDVAALAPEIVVSAAIGVTLVLDLVVRRNANARVLSGFLAMTALGAALVAVIVNAADARPAIQTLGGLFVLDGFAIVFKGLFLAVGVVVVLLSMPPMRRHRYEGEYYFLLLCSILGAMLMASARDLLTLFVALELVSVPAFVIAGIRKQSPRSNEAALKFFLIGVLSAGVFAYGISLVYGFTGTTKLSDISLVIASAGGEVQSLLLTGIVFIIAAFGFKVSAVPFHFWAPDTYEGSPTPLAAYLSVGSKAAGFVGLALVLLLAFPEVARFWGPVVGALSAATMTLGNVLALKQRQLIRLLAYSSIAHAGYMLIPLALIAPYTGSPLSGANAELVPALTTYLLVYAAMNLGAFAVAIGLSKLYPTLLIRDLAGLARKAPFPALALAVFMISLGGIPPFAGWFAKFAVFVAAVSETGPLGLTLAVLMVLNSVISLYYYLGVVRTMYLTEPTDDVAIRMPSLVRIGIAVTVVIVVAGGVFPEPFSRIARAAQIAIF